MDKGRPKPHDAHRLTQFGNLSVLSGLFWTLILHLIDLHPTASRKLNFYLYPISHFWLTFYLIQYSISRSWAVFICVVFLHILEQTTACHFHDKWKLKSRTPVCLVIPKWPATSPWAPSVCPPRSPLTCVTWQRADLYSWVALSCLVTVIVNNLVVRMPSATDTRTTHFFSEQSLVRAWTPL